MTKPRLLIISHDIVDAKMAGPGMRYFEMARAIPADIDVTLAIPNSPGQFSDQSVRFAIYSLERQAELRDLVEKLMDEVRDVVLVSSFLIDKFPFLAVLKQRVVVDFYDPFVLENLYYYLDQPLAVQESLNDKSVQLTNQLTQAGDFFICGNERQRDYWLGVLTANGRVNPGAFAQDPSLRSLIDVVGIGIPEREPGKRTNDVRQTNGVRNPLLRNTYPTIPEDAKIVLWGGGIWNWLDPLTLISAWPQVLERIPQARLVFLGTRHPNPEVPAHQMAARALQLAQDIGQKDRTIIFIEWLEYEAREALLLEADLGVLLQPVHLETRYSIRTRVMDCIWAELPLLISQGDITSEWVDQHHIGKTVPAGQTAQTAEAICELLAQPKASFSAGFKHLKEQHRWLQVVQPLVNFCLNGSKTAPAPTFGAPAHSLGARQTGARPWGAARPLCATSWKYGLARARQVIRQEGWKSFLKKIQRYLKW